MFRQHFPPQNVEATYRTGMKAKAGNLPENAQIEATESRVMLDSAAPGTGGLNIAAG
jgi:hypothetical protein